MYDLYECVKKKGHTILWCSDAVVFVKNIKQRKKRQETQETMASRPVELPTDNGQGKKESIYSLCDPSDFGIEAKRVIPFVPLIDRAVLHDITSETH